jgi:hypothetical protein
MILQEFPEWEKSAAWEEHCEFWGEDEAGVYGEMSSFRWFVWEDVIESNDPIYPPARVFDFMEKLLVEGDQDMQNLVATGFLEGIMSCADESRNYQWVDLLGPESRAYCKAWDDFCGCKTPGLT